MCVQKKKENINTSVLNIHNMTMYNVCERTSEVNIIYGLSLRNVVHVIIGAVRSIFLRSEGDGTEL